MGGRGSNSAGGAKGSKDGAKANEGSAGGGMAAQQEVPSATAEYMDRMNGVKKKLSREASVKLQKKMEKETVSNSDIKGKFTASEEKAIDRYTSIEFKTINGELRSGKMSAKTKATVAKMDEAMSKNVLKRDVIVYRGTDGSHGTDKAYTSTSTNPLTAGNFARGNAKMQAYVIPKGTHVLAIGGGEGEIILSRGFNLGKHKIK